MDVTTTGAPSWCKYIVIDASVRRMKVRDKRKVFNIMRSEDMNVDTFLPQMNLTLGEFSVFQVLGDSGRRTTIRKT